jgi:Na+-driven multidrug efflux pump
MSRLAVLLAFVYYLFQNKTEEDLLLCKFSQKSCDWKKIFNVIVMKSVGKSMLMCVLLQAEQRQEKWQGC